MLKKCKTQTKWWSGVFSLHIDNFKVLPTKTSKLIRESAKLITDSVLTTYKYPLVVSNLNPFLDHTVHLFQRGV